MCLFFNDCIACGELCFTELFFVSLLTLLQLHRGMLMKTDEVQIGGKTQCSVHCKFKVSDFQVVHLKCLEMHRKS